MNHTKGEWIAKEGQIYPQETGKTLALIPYFDEGNEEQVANQKLIAAAPNLLEVLMKIRNELRFGNYMGNRVEAMIQTASEAISKAKGVKQ
jgi:hypothetical protein